MSRLWFLFLWTAPAAAQISIELEARGWFSHVNSRVRVERGGIGTDIDGKSDLGFEDTAFPAGLATLRFGGHRLTFEYTPIQFSGDHTVSRTIIFNGETYTFGTRVLSGIEAKHLRLGWGYEFRIGRLVRIGPLVEANGFLLSGRLRAPDVNVESSEDLSVGLPTIGPSVEITPIPRLSIYGEATGMSAGDYGHFIRSEAGVRVRPIRFLQFSAGYRMFNLRADASNYFASLRLGGPFAGGGFRW